jgi:chromosome segregation ATPase
MKIYSIKEIVKATNDFLETDSETLNKKHNKTQNIKAPLETESIIMEAEKSLLRLKKNSKNQDVPLLLSDEITHALNNRLKSFNYKIKIKPNIKDHMINELYLFLKKKVRKNTLRLIIDEQLEIKNLNNKINFLKQTENDLKISHQILMNNYESSLKDNKDLEANNSKLNIQIDELEVNNETLINSLNQVNKKKEQLDIEINELKKNNQVLQNNLSQTNEIRVQLDIEVKELKNQLDETSLNFKKSKDKNRSYEINNFELKNTVSRYIVNNKKTQERLNLAEQSNKSELNEQGAKVKFYQDENIRLSSELLSAQKKNETIKENLNTIESEKEKISNKIKELNQSIDKKTNIIPSNFVKENEEKPKNKTEILNDQEQKSLDEVISRIFAKI